MPPFDDAGDLIAGVSAEGDSSARGLGGSSGVCRAGDFPRSCLSLLDLLDQSERKKGEFVSLSDLGDVDGEGDLLDGCWAAKEAVCSLKAE